MNRSQKSRETSNGIYAMTEGEIATELGISEREVTQILDSAMGKLRRRPDLYARLVAAIELRSPKPHFECAPVTPINHFMNRFTERRTRK